MCHLTYLYIIIMSSDMFVGIMKSPSAPKKRATRQHADSTRQKIVEMALEMFSRLGYEGVSIRGLETAAEVQRGSVAHHFKNKELLWKAAVTHLLENFANTFDPLLPLLHDLDEEARMQAIVTSIVRFSAEMPELNRLVLQEGRQKSWRLDFIVDNFIRPRMARLEGLSDLVKDPHAYYIALGAATLVFAVGEECKQVFDIDPKDDQFIREHASRITRMILAIQK